MFGIGLPELILIMALALIVVGPDKLPGLAKTVARQLVELKKAAGALQDSLKEETKGIPWEDGREDEPSLAPPSSHLEGIVGTAAEDEASPLDEPVDEPTDDGDDEPPPAEPPREV
jgi:Tat protein translocase TatB subunit